MPVTLGFDCHKPPAILLAKRVGEIPNADFGRICQNFSIVLAGHPWRPLCSRMSFQNTPVYRKTLLRAPLKIRPFLTHRERGTMPCTGAASARLLMVSFTLAAR